MYIKIRYGGWPNISDIIKIPLFFLEVLHYLQQHKKHKSILLLDYNKTRKAKTKQNKTKQSNFFRVALTEILHLDTDISFNTPSKTY